MGTVQGRHHRGHGCERSALPATWLVFTAATVLCASALPLHSKPSIATIMSVSWNFGNCCMYMRSRRRDQPCISLVTNCIYVVFLVDHLRSRFLPGELNLSADHRGHFYLMHYSYGMYFSNLSMAVRARRCGLHVAATGRLWPHLTAPADVPVSSTTEYTCRPLSFSTQIVQLYESHARSYNI